MKAVKGLFISLGLLCSLSTLTLAQQAAMATLSGRVLDPRNQDHDLLCASVSLWLII